MKCSIGTLNKHQTSLLAWESDVHTEQQNQNSPVCFSLTLWFLRGAQDPIPSRTRPSNSSAPMVLSLKAWESRSLQGLPKTYGLKHNLEQQKPPVRNDWGFLRSKAREAEEAQASGPQVRNAPQTQAAGLSLKLVNWPVGCTAIYCII